MVLAYYWDEKIGYKWNLFSCQCYQGFRFHDHIDSQHEL